LLLLSKNHSLFYNKQQKAVPENYLKRIPKDNFYLKLYLEYEAYSEETGITIYYIFKHNKVD